MLAIAFLGDSGLTMEENTSSASDTAVTTVGMMALMTFPAPLTCAFVGGSKVTLQQ